MFTLPQLPYATNALEPYIDAQTMEIHHGKHHATYVKNLNDLVTGKDEKDLEELLKATANPKIKNNGGGHYNHSLFWQMMAPPPAGGLEGKLADAINSTFGNLDGFKEKFAAAALGRFGSGWVWLSLDNGNLMIEDSSNQDNPVMSRRKPILGLDVWEHAYYLKYQNRRADYIAAWWNVVDWKFVSGRFESDPV